MDGWMFTFAAADDQTQLSADTGTGHLAVVARQNGPRRCEACTHHTKCNTDGWPLEGGQGQQNSFRDPTLGPFVLTATDRQETLGFILA